MKKGLLSLVVVVLLGGVGAYYFVGISAEREVKSTVRDLNAVLKQKMQHGQELKFAVANYKRGFFSSTADLQISMDINLPKTDNRPAYRLPHMSYPLKLDIQHGPFIFSKGTFGVAYVDAEVNVPENLKSMANMMFEEQSTLPKLTVESVLAFNQDDKLVIKIPPFKLFPRGKKGELVWGGLESIYNLSDKRTRVDGETIMREVSFDSQRVQAKLGEIKATYDINLSPYKIWVGNSTFNFPSMEVLAQGRKLFQLTGFSMSSTANINADLLNMGLVMNLTKVVVNGADYGPGSMEMAFNGLDASVFSNLQEKVQAINAGAYTQIQKQQMLMQLLPNLGDLLAKGAVLELKKLTMALPQGVVDGQAKISVPKGIKVGSPQALAGQLKATAKLQVPAVLVKGALKEKVVSNILLQQQMLRKKNQMSENQPPVDENEMDSAETRTQMPESTAKLLSPAQISQLADERTAAQLEKLIKHKVIIEEGSLYRIEVSFDRGQLKVNGQPFSPELLKQ